MTMDDYLPTLLKRERKKAAVEFNKNPRHELITLAGALQNWNGDYAGNPDLRWEYRAVETDAIRFTGTGASWNQILIQECKREPARLRELIATNPSIAAQLRTNAEQWLADFGSGEILLRRGNQDQWKVLDGMNEFVLAVLNDHKSIHAFVTLNEDKVRPRCEPHTVYDFIKAYERHANDDEGLQQLIAGLTLLNREYANVESLLRDRFDPSKRNMPDNGVEKAIAAVLAQ